MRQLPKSVINEMTDSDYNLLKMKYKNLVAENKFMFIVLLGSIILNVVFISDMFA